MEWILFCTLSHRAMHKALLLALMVTATSVLAADRTGIQIARAWAQIVAPGQETLAVYVTAVSTPGDTLIGISSPNAGHAAIYTTLMKGGHASLHPMTDGMILAPNQPMLMAPDGTQIRLTDLNQTPSDGQQLTLVLSFARAGTMSINVPVVSSIAASPVP